MTTRPFTVALTGGIGSGKSTVSALFAELGVPVIDADEISRRVARPGGAAYAEMAALLGPDALAADGSIRRDYARRLAFRDDTLRRELERIVHPIVRDEMDRAIAATERPYCIVSIPLLVETGMAGRFDRVLIVDAPESEQVRRTAGRDGVNAEDVARIMQRQASRQARIDVADDVIDNSGSLESLRARVHELHGRYLALARQRAGEEA